MRKYGTHYIESDSQLNGLTSSVCNIDCSELDVFLFVQQLWISKENKRCHEISTNDRQQDHADQNINHVVLSSNCQYAVTQTRLCKINPTFDR